MEIDQKSLSSSKIKGVWELPDILHQIKAIHIRASFVVAFSFLVYP
jgi:hypothetical protein